MTDHTCPVLNEIVAFLRYATPFEIMCARHGALSDTGYITALEILAKEKPETPEGTCPVCQGNTPTLQLVNTGLDTAGHHLKMTDCRFCNGTGHVNKEALHNHAVGRQLLIARAKRGISIEEVIERFGVTAAQLHDVEQGRAHHNTIPGLYEAMMGDENV